MRYNVAQLLKEHVGATRQFDIDEPPFRIDDSLEVLDRLRGEVKATRTNRGVVSDTRLSTRIGQQCSRCLNDVTQPITIRFVEEYFPTVDLRTGLPARQPEEGAGFMLNEAHEMDLTEPVRQMLLLEQPMKPLCHPACPGLCPTCGHNRNDGPCTCAPEPADARLGPLAEWLKAHSTD